MEHGKGSVCTKRKAYRAGRKETAVKVYTVMQESRYLLVQNVPALGVVDDLLRLFAQFGPVEEHRLLDDFPVTDEFTDVYWIKFQFIANARWAKKKCDDLNFFSKLLHVTYAPEFESVTETRMKLYERRQYLVSRVTANVREEKRRETAEALAVDPWVMAPSLAASQLPWATPTPGGCHHFPPSPLEAALEEHRQAKLPRPSIVVNDPAATALLATGTVSLQNSSMDRTVTAIRTTLTSLGRTQPREAIPQQVHHHHSQFGSSHHLSHQAHPHDSHQYIHTQHTQHAEHAHPKQNAPLAQHTQGSQHSHSTQHTIRGQPNGLQQAQRAPNMASHAATTTEAAADTSSAATPGVVSVASAATVTKPRARKRI